MNNKKILITGGTGSLGTALQARLAKDNQLYILSRGEQRQSELPDNVVGMIGDVRDLERLRMATYGVDVVIHCAALKHIDICEKEPMECIETNVVGAKNVIKACIENKVPKVIALSTDKSVNPINMYGASKLASDKLFLNAKSYARNIHNEPWEQHKITQIKQKFCVVRYGNVMGSNGSVIPKWIELAKQGKPLPITDPQMTRFMMTMDSAVEMVINAKEGMNVARCPSMKIDDIAITVAAWVAHKMHPNEVVTGSQMKTIGIRAGEKLHEQLDTDYYSNTNKDWMSAETLTEWLEANYG